MRTFDASELIHRFASLVEERSADEPDAAAANDLRLIEAAVENYALRFAGYPVLAVRGSLPGKLRRFSDLLRSGRFRWSCQANDRGWTTLTKVVRALEAWARNYAGYNLIEGRPLGVVAGRGGLKLG